MVTIDHESSHTPFDPDERAARSCPGCGAADRMGDDFCHACGHAFAHFAEVSDFAFDGDVHSDRCAICGTGELVRLDHGRTQCDSCGYMVRDEG
jgi:hypothetical protein